MVVGVVSDGDPAWSSLSLQVASESISARQSIGKGLDPLLFSSHCFRPTLVPHSLGDHDMFLHRVSIEQKLVPPAVRWEGFGLRVHPCPAPLTRGDWPYVHP